MTTLPSPSTPASFVPRTKRLFRSTVVLTAGQVAGYGLSFVRTAILARALTKADFGLSVVFAMAVSLLELAGRMSFGQQIIQSREGSTDRFVATSHTFQLVIAAASAVLMLACSFPLAAAMNVPAHGWAFATLALIPLGRGLENLDYFRQQRDYRYGPAVLSELLPQVIVTALAWPVARWIPDFRAIVLLMIAKTALTVAATHWLAQRPYHLAWDRDHVRRMWRFGYPLLLNGLLIFGSQQADQVVVAGFLSLEKLALYALALTLVTTPGMIFARVSSALILPVLSEVQDDLEAFRRNYRVSVQYAAIVAVALLLPFILVGDPLVTLCFGAKYAGGGTVIGLLAAAAAIRFLRIVPAIASMARADTLNQLSSNVVRCLSLPLAVWVAVSGGGMAAIAICALAAELIAAATSLVMLYRRQHVPWSDSTAPVLYLLVCLAVALISPRVLLPAAGYLPAAGMLVIVLGAALLAAWLLFPRVRQLRS